MTDYIAQYKQQLLQAGRLCWVVPWPYTRGHFRLDGQYLRLPDEVFFTFLCAARLTPYPELTALQALGSGTLLARTAALSALDAHSDAGLCRDAVFTEPISRLLRLSMDLGTEVHFGPGLSLAAQRRGDLWLSRMVPLLRGQNALALRERRKDAALYAAAYALITALCQKEGLL